MVLVADCHDPAEATVIRTILSMHGIDAVIPEGASSAGVAAVGFYTHVFVPRARAEEARILIAELRSHKEPDPDEGEGEDDDDSTDVAGVLDRRKKVGAAVLFAVLIQWGTGHMSTGAWMRGLACAVLQFFGLRLLWDGERLGVVVWVAAVALDLVGAVVRASRARVPLPRAQVRVPGSRAPR
jgi:hypothetical protein